ncbi:hypothetical protein AJ80_09906 [Polytolypa hystricis UAMH7299]|uniref:AAA+ ATPase domain-containing protein n=1 Tax=Polytolypa hystricis (strain UAMH7299) TaxID=1447883 RepID=A0A2B7WGX7_POLH7|nr:hypothetical protein AJ80_09906 [Polytolypa hystricis UAMH7299]
MDFNTTSSLTNLTLEILKESLPGYFRLFHLIEPFLNSLTPGSSIIMKTCTALVILILARLWLFEPIKEFGTTKVVLDSKDPAYGYLRSFMERKNLRGCDQRVKTEVEDPMPTQELKTDQLFSGVELEQNKPLKYFPNGPYWFFHNRQPIWFTVERQLIFYFSEERFILRCLGWSSRPIDKLLRTARSEYLSHNQFRIRVYTPESKSNRSHRPWTSSEELVRPLETVILPDKIKQRALDDMNKFLRNQKWYQEQGIAHRRGYLFHGPPGSGKSSLGFALSCHFRIPLYIISLGDRSLTDAELLMLFKNLHPPCLVLLEDVDAAGIGQSRAEPEESQMEKSAPLSLAGLLQAMDGPGSAQGRILIMTTNYAGALDPALLRPGRIDERVVFPFMTEGQIKDMFMAMYSPKSCSNNAASGNQAVVKLAERFAAAVPENKLSSAEVQGYLMRWKDDSQGAVNGVDRWKLTDYGRK